MSSSSRQTESPASDTVAGFVAPIPIPRFEEFQAVMRQGLRISSPHFVLHCCPSSTATQATTAAIDNRIGALLPKRWAKKAVRRNLLRRKIYALAALHLPALAQAANQQLDCVVRLRASWLASDFPSAASCALRDVAGQELTQLFTQAQSKLSKQGSAAFTPSSGPKPTAQAKHG
ncbi:MAG: ribonuclease P protein component [Brachymonas sp.]